MISVLILTKNEEQALPACLASVRWSTDIWVLDSGSTDRTRAIAEAAGAHVVERSFDNWAAHQNWALLHIPFRHPWVFYLDADERVSPQLAISLQQTVTEAADTAHLHAPLTTAPHVAYEVHRRDFMDSTWLRHAQMSTFYVRLFRPERIHYERLVNPVTHVDGATGRLHGYLDHYPFSKGVGWWITRHNDYSTREAQQLLQNRADASAFRLSSALFEKDLQTRRKQQKLLFYRLPGRPLLKFFYLYIVKRGFLDGAAGFRYATLQSIYEYLIVLKTHELESSTSLGSASEHRPSHF